VNAAVAVWRAEMAQLPAFRTADLDELESHLRDAILDFESRDLSSEEAFTIARQRIGGAPALAAEFARVNGYTPWIDRILWMLAGWVCISTIQTCITSFEIFSETTRFANFPASLVFAVMWLAPLFIVMLWALSIAPWSVNFLRRPRQWFLKPGSLAVASLLVMLLSATFRFVGATHFVGGERSWSMLRAGYLASIVIRGPGGARYIGASSLILSLIGWSFISLLILILASRRQRLAHR